ncbi:phosphoenolpyruvate carboxykinase domain-containing protein, partial [Frankia sp. EI5c]|uniref:phosphoenolpyruvate carboxykinase domain-containing protein n=1 Tax=Frankia sp. EI5c TaxID=683316 RepID=UPI001F5B41B4
GVETPLGILPAPGELPTEGLDVSAEDLATLLSVDSEVWRQEAELIPEHYNTFGDSLPEELWAEHEALTKRLNG